MNQSNYYSIKSKIEFKFKNSQIRDFSYKSFLPELNKVKSYRSRVSMEKINNSIIFYIESTDITAFRASINDIISLGKIIDHTMKLCE